MNCLGLPWRRSLTARCARDVAPHAPVPTPRARPKHSAHRMVLGQPYALQGSPGSPYLLDISSPYPDPGAVLMGAGGAVGKLGTEAVHLWAECRGKKASFLEKINGQMILPKSQPTWKPSKKIKETGESQPLSAAEDLSAILQTARSGVEATTGSGPHGMSVALPRVRGVRPQVARSQW